ncbi:site-specific DNA-methyltransferase [Priestia endophytica]
MATLEENRERLINKLKDIFQFDQADLDFGIYRIMNQKREQINKFLYEDLSKQIDKEMQVLKKNPNKDKFDEINEKINMLEKMNDDGSLDRKIKELCEEREVYSSHSGLEDITSEVYSHLTEFLSRYYDNGDFISQRRYKDGAYVIPYEGEEVKLYWANSDQYYVKSSEYFKDYTFKDSFGKTIHFKLLEVEQEKDNNKGEKKTFHIANGIESNPEVIDEELWIYFEYTEDKEKQNKRTKEAVEYLVENMQSDEFYDFIHLLKSSKKSEKSLMEKQITRYTARNTFDYFIHKDLRGFLKRELDSYIKNEVVFLDDIESNDDQKMREYMTKAKVIRNITVQVINFLVQIEEFQKKLWTKKKFVVESNYCITLDRIPEYLYDEVCKNEEQIEEWIRLFSINEITSTSGDLFDSDTVGFTRPLTIEFLRNNQNLVLDTKFFSHEFKEKLIGSIKNFDENLDGILINSDNYQALSLLQEKYLNQIDCVHIDPPYNTDTSGFLYKNNFRHSSWATMMENRLSMARGLLEENSGSLMCHIDENEYELLFNITDTMNVDNAGTIVWNKLNPMLGRKGVATQHEYIIYRSNYDQSIYANSDHITTMYEVVDELKEKGIDLETAREEYKQWLRNQEDFSGGEKAYKYISNEWQIYRLVAMGAPEKRTDPKFYIPLKHPVTNKDCPVPPNGWSRTPETMQNLLSEGLIAFGEDDTTQPQKIVTLDRSARKQIASVINDGKSGKADLDKLGFEFPYAHPVSLYEILLSANNPNTIMDFFAGSGTTGHATINLNRMDNGNRKYILVEMGDYIDSTTKPRLEKVIYSDEWKDGKPLSRNGVSQAFQYLRLESYEDSLNNIVFDSNSLYSMLPDGSVVSKEYMLNYMLTMETKNSDCLLNIDKLKHPFDYQMQIIEQGETKRRNIDLIQTFNYLIGLYVNHNYAMEGFDAEFEENEYGHVSANLSHGTTYRLKMLEGMTRSGKKTLVIWRDLTGDIVKDNAVLNAYVQKNKIENKNYDYDLIYVNGDNFLKNIEEVHSKVKVRLIDEEMKRRLFEMED